ncbi:MULTISPECIES: RnfH family protein [Methylococcus]|uniref:Protein RnfH n=3 Tax=Methylococcus capsulatus TaxID=414 RepID=RNFH_METCA|nr:RnfH family protein [Methylococcus capsulatus]Q603I8.1 RecName: Full=Protein RnfH [Methylococcus capsulatus str. Bath]AAU91048.1 electron transport complex, H subunit [Methylococcus capsulatus str. Bath]QXP86707.1 RnfH family protein [Methylococcus capsulatus]QXP91966.1 RnfH family protein [Methylococcus capsulatus]QXP93615.1 RnfH family protein [Methylococcus capsulatus]UQN11675.1 RnfH family protein [Methylococcus capsulatus]
MNVGVCYADADRQLWLRMEMPDDSTVEQAIRYSGILERFPEIDLSVQKVGIFGKLVKLDAPVKEGDRIEIYRPITADPKTVRRRKIASDDDDDDD